MNIYENNTVFNPSTKSIPTIDSESYGLDTEGELPCSGADIYSTGNIIIKNNTFTNSKASNTASSIYSYLNIYEFGTKQHNHHRQHIHQL